MSLREAVVEEAAPSEDAYAEVVLIFRAENPNKDPLPLLEAVYAVRLEGRTVFAGTRALRVTVPALSSQDVVLPFPARGARAGMRVRLDGTIGYLPADAWARTKLDAGLPPTTVRFVGEGLVRD